MPAHSQWTPPKNSAPKTAQVVARSVVLHTTEQYSPHAEKNDAGASHATIISTAPATLTPPAMIVSSQTGASHHRNTRTLVSPPSHLPQRISCVESGVVIRLTSVSP